MIDDYLCFVAIAVGVFGFTIPPGWSATGVAIAAWTDRALRAAQAITAEAA